MRLGAVGDDDGGIGLRGAALRGECRGPDDRTLHPQLSPYVGRADRAADADGSAERGLELRTADGKEFVELEAKVEARRLTAGEDDAARGVERAVAAPRVQRAHLDRVPGGGELGPDLLVRRAGRHQRQASVRERRSALGSRGDARPGDSHVHREPAAGLAHVCGHQGAGDPQIEPIGIHPDREGLLRGVPPRPGPCEIDRHGAVDTELARLGVSEEAMQDRFLLAVARVERQCPERDVAHAERVRAQRRRETRRLGRATDARLQRQRPAARLAPGECAERGELEPDDLERCVARAGESHPAGERHALHVRREHDACGAHRLVRDRHRGRVGETP